ncbi:MAG: peptidase M28 family protein, partial [Bacteroidota bacterium]|nr:peptidase M28 family protein [Bacteroidota bacterium]MEC9187540.1 peptidase M28 family protein [Bacteroidota bacterium]
IRCVLYMNEENGNRGGKTYAEIVRKKGEKHLFALESDRGGFSPRGFSIDGTPLQLQFIQGFEPLFEPYQLHLFNKGYGGVDIGPLRNGTTCLVGLVPDSQRYFDYHHAPTDVFENVNKRELELGSSAITSMIYLIDKYGFPDRNDYKQ